MEENTIVLKRIDSIKLKLVTEDGEPTGEYLYIKVKDVDAPKRFQKMIDDLQKIWIEFRDKITIIEKQIAPHIDLTFKSMTDKIREKYMFNAQKENVLE